MTVALPHTIPVTQAVLNVLASFEGVTEQGDNGGEMVHWMQRDLGALDKPWCACALSRAGRSALGDLWPIPRAIAAGCQPIHDWAKRQGLLSEAPAPYALALWYHPELRRYAHVGYVIDVHEADSKALIAVTSWEGNTNREGLREGKRFMKKTRMVQPTTRFVLWWLALGAGASDPRGAR